MPRNEEHGPEQRASKEDPVPKATKKPEASDRLLKCDEVAEILAVNKRTVWRMSRPDALGRIQLPAVRLGGGRRITRFRRSDVDRIIEEGLPDLIRWPGCAARRVR
jgi:predicted DNA-binding transcriptional regulator AlpA